MRVGYENEVAQAINIVFVPHSHSYWPV